LASSRESRRNSAQLFVVIGIFLLENDGELITGNVDALTRRIESHVVYHFCDRQRSNDFAGVRIQDFETWRLAPRNENAMIRLVEK